MNVFDVPFSGHLKDDNSNPDDSPMNSELSDQILLAWSRLHENPPLIKDWSLLPYPKETILKAFDFIGNCFAKMHETAIKNKRHDEAKDIQSKMDLLFVNIDFLIDYTEIDECDKAMAQYFNGFSNIQDMPLADQRKCHAMRTKYKRRITEIYYPEISELSDRTANEFLRKHPPR